MVISSKIVSCCSITRAGIQRKHNAHNTGTEKGEGDDFNNKGITRHLKVVCGQKKRGAGGIKKKRVLPTIAAFIRFPGQGGSKKHWGGVAQGPVPRSGITAQAR